MAVRAATLGWCFRSRTTVNLRFRMWRSATYHMHGGPRDDVPRLRLERFVPIARFAIVVAIELVGAHPMGPAAAQLHGPRQLGSSAARLIRDRTTIFRDDLRLGLRELLLGQGAIPFESSQSLQLFGERHLAVEGY